ncbi:MAG: TerB family tellurite resistance protein [Gemmatimonadaceae bacterium]
MLADAIRKLFGTAAEGAAPPEATSPAPQADSTHLAVCVLLLDVAYADGTFSEEERAHLEATLERHFALPAHAVHELIVEAEEERKQAIDHFRYTNVLLQNYDVGQKMVLAEVMWSLVLADGAVNEHEHYLTRKISNLLGLEPGYLSAAKQRASERVSGSE